MKAFHPLAVLTFALAAVSLSAQAQTNTSPSATPSTPAAGATTAPAAAPNEERSTLASEDERFLENTIQGSYAEVEGSQLALEKTEDADVRAFAQSMIDDHQKMITEAETLASSKGMTPPTGPSVVQSTEITALKPLTGGAFDAMYVNRIGVAAHESTVEMFEEAAKEVQDSDIKAMIDKTLPKLREHLEMARALDRKQDQQ